MKQEKNAVEEFLQLHHIAVVGVSRSGNGVGNYIYKKLKKTGYKVYAVNPNTDLVEGDPCYPDLATLPDCVEGVIIATNPKHCKEIVQACATHGIHYVWMHRSIGEGSVDQEAVVLGSELGLSIIPGGCPMMYCEPVDFPHKCMRLILKVTGKMPKPEYFCK